MAAKQDRTSIEEEQKKSSDPKASRRLIAVTLLLVLAAAAGASWFGWWYFHARFFVSTEDAFIDARILRIAPQEPGRVVALPVDANQHVTEGTILARLDPEMAQAMVAKAEAALKKAATGITAAEARLDQAKAAVDRQTSAAQAARVAAENASRQAERSRQIVTDSNNITVSKQQLDNAEADARASQAKADEAEKAIQEAKRAVEVAEASVAASKADHLAAIANLKVAQVTLDHMTISAPVDGEIVAPSVGVGSFVTTGMEMMALVPDDIYITANFKETELAGLHPGLAVDVAVDAYPDVTFHGEVLSVQKGAGQAFQLLPPQNATGNFVKVVQRVPVRISIKAGTEGHYVLGPGMSVVPTVHLERP